MADPDEQNGFEWIEKVKSGGSVPLLNPENCASGWAVPPGDKFLVRGPQYFSNKVKVPGGSYLLSPLGFDWIKGPSKIYKFLRDPNCRVRRAMDNDMKVGHKPFIWAFNLQLPHKENYSAVIYFASLEPFPEESLVNQFVKGDDAFRSSRLKLIANIVKGPWVVRTAVGEQAVCVLGRAVSCRYVVGLDYMEVDVDIGASVMANAIVHLAFGYITALTIDLAFLIEGQNERELPEQILGAIRISELKPGSAVRVEQCTASESPRDIPSFLPTRLWKTIGQSFSNLLHSDVRDEHSYSTTINTSQHKSL